METRDGIRTRVCLTPYEGRLIDFLVQDMTVIEIAGKLNTNYHKLSSRIYRLKIKLNVKTRVGVVNYYNEFIKKSY